ncbi:hypothetical protein U9M48_017858 [Paspalum notatum var. saurae]|uniref:CASP-like protein n=1 Tax=Paspalum notatum var. saurae TaxID=547442 RepID=A0AAQ3TB68_PASNO
MPPSQPLPPRAAARSRPLLLSRRRLLLSPRLLSCARLPPCRRFFFLRPTGRSSPRRPSLPLRLPSSPPVLPSRSALLSYAALLSTGGLVLLSGPLARCGSDELKRRTRPWAAPPPPPPGSPPASRSPCAASPLLHWCLCRRRPWRWRSPPPAALLVQDPPVRVLCVAGPPCRRPPKGAAPSPVALDPPALLRSSGSGSARERRRLSTMEVREGIGVGGRVDRCRLSVSCIENRVFSLAMMSAGSAAAAVANLNRTGIKHTALPNFCKPLPRFCNLSAASIAAAFLCCVFLAASAVIDVIWLSRHRDG